MGSGKYTEEQCKLLHKRLDEALGHLSGEQQNGLQGSTYSPEEGAEADYLIDEVIADIVTALGRSEIWPMPQKKPEPKMQTVISGDNVVPGEWMSCDICGRMSPKAGIQEHEAVPHALHDRIVTLEKRCSGLERTVLPMMPIR